MTAQPEWRLVANLGDQGDPIAFGGLFVFVDETGVYPPEMERLEPLGEEDDSPIEVHRVILEPMQRVNGGLVASHYDAAWIAEHADFTEWFSGDLGAVADCCGMDLDDLTDSLCSTDPVRLARAYQAIGDYHGWANLDAYPWTMTQAEADARLESFGEVQS